LQSYQTILAALLGFAGGVFIAPRVTDSRAKRRELWRRRIALSEEMAEFPLILRTMPNLEGVTWGLLPEQFDE
jgi:hypothetical protein